MRSFYTVSTPAVYVKLLTAPLVYRLTSQLAMKFSIRTMPNLIVMHWLCKLLRPNTNLCSHLLEGVLLPRNWFVITLAH